MSELEDWDKEEAQDISTAELDTVCGHFIEAKRQYDEKKKELEEFQLKKKSQEAILLDLLDRAKKSKYYIDGMGTAYIINKLTVKTPKTVEDKQKLFNYIRDRFGPDALVDYQSINSARLNSFFNEQKTLAAEKGIADFEMPGLEAPKSMTTLGFRKG